MKELDALDQATIRYRELEKAREDVIAAVVAALEAGATPTEVTAHSPFTAAHVRKMARDHGIPPARPGIKPAKKPSESA